MGLLVAMDRPSEPANFVAWRLDVPLEMCLCVWRSETLLMSSLNVSYEDDIFTQRPVAPEVVAVHDRRRLDIAFA